MPRFQKFQKEQSTESSDSSEVEELIVSPELQKKFDILFGPDSPNKCRGPQSQETEIAAKSNERAETEVCSGDAVSALSGVSEASTSGRKRSGSASEWGHVSKQPRVQTQVASQVGQNSRPILSSAKDLEDTPKPEPPSCLEKLMKHEAEYDRLVRQLKEQQQCAGPEAKKRVKALKKTIRTQKRRMRVTKEWIWKDE